MTPNDGKCKLANGDNTYLGRHMVGPANEIFNVLINRIQTEKDLKFPFWKVDLPSREESTKSFALKTEQKR